VLGNLQRDLDRLEERSSRNLVKLNKNKCQVLHLGRYSLNSSSEDLGVMSDSKLNMSLQCSLSTKKAKSILNCINTNMASRLKKMLVLTSLNTH